MCKTSVKQGHYIIEQFCIYNSKKNYIQKKKLMWLIVIISALCD